jgi:hypothetical protein
LKGEGSYKAAKGLIRVKIIVQEEKIRDVTISGDFFMYPEDSLWKLETALRGLPPNMEAVRAQLEDFYAKNGVLSPGLKPEDFAEAIYRALATLLS